MSAERADEDLERIFRELRVWLPTYAGAEFSYLGCCRGDARIRFLRGRLLFTVGEPRVVEPAGFGPFRFGVLPCVLRDDGTRLMTTSVGALLEGAFSGTVRTGRVIPDAMEFPIDSRGASGWRDARATVAGCDWRAREIEVCGEDARGLIDESEWDALDGALLSGGVAGLPPVFGIRGLARMLGVSLRDFHSHCPSLTVLAPVCFGALTELDDAGAVRLVVETPAPVRPSDVRVSLFDGDERSHGVENLGSSTWIRSDAADGLVRLSRVVEARGPSPLRHACVMYGGREVARCAFAQPPRTSHAYSILDSGHVGLDRALRAGGKGREFEHACGALLSMAGFRAIPLSHLGEPGDWLVTASDSALDATTERTSLRSLVDRDPATERWWFLVECSTAPKDKGRIRLLASRARVLAKRTGTETRPVLMLLIGLEELATDMMAICEAEHVKVLGSGELRTLARLAARPHCPDRIREAAALLAGEEWTGDEGELEDT